MHFSQYIKRNYIDSTQIMPEILRGHTQEYP